MTFIAFLLIIASSFVHSGWNLLVKRSLDKIAFLWCAIAFSLILYFPLFIYFIRECNVTLEAWMCVVTSGLLEATYFALLGAAYTAGDLSVVYPLSRGSAPVFVLILAVLFLDEQVSVIGLTGIMIIAVGTFALHFESSEQQRLAIRRPFASRSSILALLTGLCIALYHVVDKLGVQHLEPFPYAYLVFLFTLLFFTAFMLLTRKSDVIRLEWHKNKRSTVLVGFMYFFAYLLVLIAMKLVDVTYIGAARNINIVISALMGCLILKEKYGRIRALSASLIFAGVLLITLAQ